MKSLAKGFCCFPVSGLFLYSRDFVVSPVSRYFWTDVGSGPLRDERSFPVKTVPHDDPPWPYRPKAGQGLVFKTMICLNV